MVIISLRKRDLSLGKLNYLKENLEQVP